ncbi:MAG: DUF6550 family protein [Bacillota bacterium]|nr:DUF6550 family protein [Bacillota bacterium]
MKKMTIKTQRRILTSALLVVCVILVGVIYIRMNEDKPNTDILINEIETNANEPEVEAIETPEESVIVEVPEINIDETKKEDVKVTEEEIKEPIPTKPKKPDNTPPEQKPETSDNVKDMTKEPEYEEEEVVYVLDELEEADLATEEVTDPNQNSADEESNLVPDSENPFLQDNIPNNGDGGFQDSSDYSDHVPGTGDKF